VLVRFSWNPTGAAQSLWSFDLMKRNFEPTAGKYFADLCSYIHTNQMI
jgi:hypothetical protein